MSAISYMLGSKYYCNLSFYRLHSAISKIALSISNPRFWTNLVKRNISKFAVVFERVNVGV